MPALRASRPDLAQVLRASGRTPALGGAARLRNAVIVAEVALSFVLLIGSGLMVRSFVSLMRTEPGFDPNGVLTFGLSNLRFRSPDEARAIFGQMRDKLARDPGRHRRYRRANAVPFDGNDPSGRWGTQDAMNDPTRFRQGGFIIVPPSYFDAMRVKLLAGRIFTQAENDDPNTKLIVIDDETAKLAYGQESPIGKTIFARIRTESARGVHGDRRRAPPSPPHALWRRERAPLLSDPVRSAAAVGSFAPSGDPAALGQAVRAAVTSLNPQYLVTEMHPLTDNVDKARSATRFALVLIGIFAAIAALLAAVGLYGVLSSTVRQRTSEIGIRMAFGAQSSSIFGLVIGQGLRMSAIGIGIGLVIADRDDASDVEHARRRAADGPDHVHRDGVCCSLGIAAAACWVPARRAAGMDPNAALRQE